MRTILSLCAVALGALFTNSCATAKPNELVITSVHKEFADREPQTDKELAEHFAAAATTYSMQIPLYTSDSGIDGFFSKYFSSAITKSTCTSPRAYELLGISIWDVTLPNKEEHYVAVYPKKLSSQWMQECFAYEKMKTVLRRGMELPENIRYAHARFDGQEYYICSFKKPKAKTISFLIEETGKSSGVQRTLNMHTLRACIRQLGKVMHAMHVPTREQKPLSPFFLNRYLRLMPRAKDYSEHSSEWEKFTSSMTHDYNSLCKDLLTLVKEPFFRYGKTFGDFSFKTLYYDASSNTVFITSPHGAAPSLLDINKRQGLPNTDIQTFFWLLGTDSTRYHLTKAERKSLVASFWVGYFSYFDNSWTNYEIAIRDLPSDAEFEIIERLQKIAMISLAYDVELLFNNPNSKEVDPEDIGRHKDFISEAFIFYGDKE